MMRNKFQDDIDFRILFLQPQPCVRTLKYAKALKQYFGKQISLCLGYTGYSLNRIYGYGDECFDRMIHLNPIDIPDDIQDVIDDFQPMLVHSHNAPNTLTLSAIKVCENVPVIHDVHEVLSVHRSGFFENDDETTMMKYREEERMANEESDKRIYATQGIKDYIENHYSVDVDDDIVFYNYVSESILPRHFKEKLSNRDGDIHIVYIGCVTSVVENSHYDLREVFKDIADNQIHIHVYPTKNIITQSGHSYKKLDDANKFIHLHNNLSRRNLLQEITKYDFGWAGLNRAENNKHLEIVFPNKITEYIASGLPVLAFPHETIKKFIEKNGVGLTFSNIDGLESRLDKPEVSKMRENTLHVRHHLTIEKQIPKLVNFYEQIINN
jgi:glycosyltransferase involved in cell wall biosynthesis